MAPASDRITRGVRSARELTANAVQLAARARDPGFVLNARRTLLPLPLVDRPSAPPRPPFAATRARPVPELAGKRVAVVASAGGGRTVAVVGAARAFEEARVVPDCIGAVSGSVLWASMWAAGLNAREMADFSLSWRPQDYLGVQWARLPRFFASAARGFAGLGRGEALERLFDQRLWHMTAGETEFPLRTLVYNLDRRQLEVFGSERTPDLRLGELARIAMARPVAGEAVRVEGDLYADGGTFDPFPHKRLAGREFDSVFAIDVAGTHPVGKADRLTRVTPFEDRVTIGMDRYGMFIDRRDWPGHIRAGYTATRAAIDELRERPTSGRARRSGAGRS